ncbi:MAG TPA: hypothetical protein VEO91_11455, partial [Candidatus Limnocylindria bacterium]|nr:hypothetical protein [Candidatus Limnocylindria bacterium]
MDRSSNSTDYEGRPGRSRNPAGTVGRILAGLAIAGSALASGSGSLPTSPSAPRAAASATDAAHAPVLAAARSRVTQRVAAPTSYTPGHLSLSLARVAGGFSQPLFVTNAHDKTNRLFVVEQGGRIKL